MKFSELEAATPGLVTVIGKIPAVANSVAVTLAVIEVLEPKVVASGVAPKLTTVPVTKELPVRVSVNGALALIALFCERLVRTAIGLTVKLIAFEAATPGLTTVMGKVPAVANCAAVISAVIEVLLPNCVVSEVDANFTTVPLMKLVPVSVKLKPAPPRVPMVCDKLVSVATGLTVKSIALEAATPGLTTVMGKVPATANSVEVMSAVIEVLEPNCVVSDVDANFTTAPSTN